MDKKISKLFFCHCAQLALSFDKVMVFLGGVDIWGDEIVVMD